MNATRLVLLAVVLACLLIVIGGATIVGGLLFLMPWSTQARAAITPSAQTEVTAGALRAGAEAPDLSLQNLDMQTVRLGDFQGKPVMLNFWATWCGPCSAEMPNIEKAYQDYQGKGVVILALNQAERPDQVKGYADLYHLHFPILLDKASEVGRAYRLQALPTTVFINRDATIHEIHVGGPMSVSFIEARLEALLGGKP
jgi:peroxiredoxin